MMSAASVVEILDLLESYGVKVWVDGGWGVDALVCEQTREHDDLDLIIPEDHVPTCRELLEQRGFTLYRDELPCSFVLGDKDDRRVDIHPIRFDSQGGGLQYQPNGIDWRYPPEGFSGVGWIGGRLVHCLTAEVQVICHDGYELDAGDYADMRLLRDRLEIDLPERFEQEFRRQVEAAGEAILMEIHEAFEGVDRSGGVSWSETVVIDGYGSDSACAAARASDKDKSWLEVANDPNWSMSPGVGGFAFLDAIGFRYYIAAAMARALREELDSDSEFLAFALCNPEGWNDSKWALLSKRQRACVRRFIQHMAWASDIEGYRCSTWHDTLASYFVAPD